MSLGVEPWKQCCSHGVSSFHEPSVNISYSPSPRLLLLSQSAMSSAGVRTLDGATSRDGLNCLNSRINFLWVALDPRGRESSISRIALVASVPRQTPSYRRRRSVPAPRAAESSARCSVALFLSPCGQIHLLNISDGPSVPATLPRYSRIEPSALVQQDPGRRLICRCSGLRGSRRWSRKLTPSSPVSVHLDEASVC